MTLGESQEENEKRDECNALPAKPSEGQMIVIVLLMPFPEGRENTSLYILNDINCIVNLNQQVTRQATDDSSECPF